MQRYQQIAIAQAHAGAHMVGPSGMMDGQVASIREALDGGGFQQVGILAYAAKFASAFYGPFREAAEAAPAFGDRTGYQMDPPNSDEAMREIRADITEGADIVMVKPALPYLDVIRRAKQETGWPLPPEARGPAHGDPGLTENGLIERRPTVLVVVEPIGNDGARRCGPILRDQPPVASNSVSGKRILATVVRFPFYDLEKTRPRS